MCAPLFAGALHIKTGKSLSESLERVQRNFCKILFPNKDYLSSLNELDLLKISERRLKLTKKFGHKMASNPKFAYLFPKVPKSNTMHFILKINDTVHVIYRDVLSPQPSYFVSLFQIQNFCDFVCHEILGAQQLLSTVAFIQCKVSIKMIESHKS